MPAKRIDGQAVNGKRTVLADVIPLDTPYAITFFPIYACNFKCNYCIHSLAPEQRGDITDRISMDYELYKKCIDDISYFSEKLKVLHFIGYGEPLLHKDIDKMVEYAVRKNVANTVDIVTNGALLDPKLSTKLINAGLNTLRISLQGINSESYQERSSVKLDFESFHKNIEYFYENRKDTKLHIKIIDTGLSNGEKETFLEKFSNICDTIAIEHLVPVVNKFDYNKIKNKAPNNFSFDINTLGNKIVDSVICSQPFYSMQINPDGRCVPCCSSDVPICVGNANEESIVKIWNSNRFNEFREMQLLKQKSNNPICATCTQYKYSMFTEEVLDDNAVRLALLFKQKEVMF